MVVPCIVKLFSATDRHVRLFWSDGLHAFAHRANRIHIWRTRATRMSLLQNLDRFASHLTDAVVNESVFPQIALGFSVCGTALECCMEVVLPCFFKTVRTRPRGHHRSRVLPFA
jgi:hypothetical protein